MSNIKRFSVSVEDDILKLVDDQVRKGRYPNRSDALRAMIRAQTASHAVQEHGEILAQIGIIYDHHKRNLVNQILHAQHDTPASILGAQHFHLDHHHCVESILARGKVRDLERLHKTLQSLRGIKHASLSVLAPAKHLI